MARKPTGRTPGRPKGRVQYLSDTRLVVEMRVLVLNGEVSDYKEAAYLMVHEAEPPGVTVTRRSKARRLQRNYDEWIGKPWFVTRVNAAMQRPRAKRREPAFLRASQLTAEAIRVHEIHLEHIKYIEALARIVQDIVRHPRDYD